VGKNGRVVFGKGDLTEIDGIIVVGEHDGAVGGLTGVELSQFFSWLGDALGGKRRKIMLSGVKLWMGIAVL